MFTDHTFYVYILTNKSHHVLYTGVTNNLTRRINEHKADLSGFTARYHAHTLVYFEEFQRIEDAISREKQIKGGSRKKKFELVNSINPEWNDLMEI
jgi:putative endonuclease